MFLKAITFFYIINSIYDYILDRYGDGLKYWPKFCPYSNTKLRNKK